MEGRLLQDDGIGRNPMGCRAPKLETIESSPWILWTTTRTKGDLEDVDSKVHGPTYRLDTM